MEMGTAILISAFVGAFSFVVKDVVNNILSGAWMRISGEIEPGDKITVKSDFKEQSGRVKELYLRNVVIRLPNGRDLLIEAKKVLNEDVIRRRD